MEARDRTVYQSEDCDVEPRINVTVLHRSFSITKIEENNTREILMFVNSEGRAVVYNHTGGFFYYFSVSCSIHQLS